MPDRWIGTSREACRSSQPVSDTGLPQLWNWICQDASPPGWALGPRLPMALSFAFPPILPG